MVMAIVWTGMVITSVLYGAATGKAEAVSAAALDGASAAVKLCLTTGGAICLWSGVMEVMRRCNLSSVLSAVLHPLIKILFPKSSTDCEVRESLAQNISANLLGLGNAATPAGIRAVQGMQRLSGNTTAGNEMCRLVVLNTASIQLLPTTIAAVRAAAGAQNAFDILPAVWMSSIVSVCVGLFAARCMEGHK